MNRFTSYTTDLYYYNDFYYYTLFEAEAVSSVLICFVGVVGQLLKRGFYNFYFYFCSRVEIKKIQINFEHETMKPSFDRLEQFTRGVQGVEIGVYTIKDFWSFIKDFLDILDNLP